LVGKCRHQFDLLVGEQTLLTVDQNGSQQFVFLDHGDRKNSSGASEFWELRGTGIEILDFCPDVGDLSWLLGRQRASERGVWIWANDWVALSLLNKRLWRTMYRDGPKGISLALIQDSEFGRAGARRIFQHRVEHRLQLAWRTADDAEDF